MSVQSDKWIIQMARDNDMISPFEDKQVRGDKISFGVSSYGYDARVSDEFFVIKFEDLKFFGSTISEFTLVKILNSSETLAS